MLDKYQEFIFNTTVRGAKICAYGEHNGDFKMYDILNNGLVIKQDDDINSKKYDMIIESTVICKIELVNGKEVSEVERIIQEGVHVATYGYKTTLDFDKQYNVIRFYFDFNIANPLSLPITYIEPTINKSSIF